jgi:hypothetical protein
MDMFSGEEGVDEFSRILKHCVMGSERLCITNVFVCTVALRSWRCPEFQKDVKLTLGNKESSSQSRAYKGTTFKNTLFFQYFLCLSFSSLSSPIIFPYSLYLYLVFPLY